MAQSKTAATQASVAGYVDALADPVKQADTRALVTLMERISGEKAQMWGPSIIGFGTHHYRYESGREGAICRIGFSPRAAALTLYGIGIEARGALLARLGKHKTGKGCLYIKRLSDVDEGILAELIEAAWQDKRSTGVGC